jgi:hypothetical protein
VSDKFLEESNEKIEKFMPNITKRSKQRAITILLILWFSEFLGVGRTQYQEQ